MMDGNVAAPEGDAIYRGHIEGPAQQAAHLGVQLAEDLLAQGAEKVLAALCHPEGGVVPTEEPVLNEVKEPSLRSSQTGGKVLRPSGLHLAPQNGSEEAP